MRRPRISAWTNSVMVVPRTVGPDGGCPPQPAAARPSAPCPSRSGVLLDDGLRRRDRLRQHDLRLAVLPLADQELALRRAGLAPLQRGGRRVARVAADPVGVLVLVVDRADWLFLFLNYLSSLER